MSRHLLFSATLFSVLLPLPSFSSEEGDVDYISEISFTASRLRQPLSETPASVTKISGDVIRQRNLRNVAEILRLVPGFVVQQEAGNTYYASYHFGISRFPRRILVMVDGQPQHRVTFSFVEYPEIPVEIEDIQHVDIIRGPASATYGENAFLAAVNIVTKDANNRSSKVSLTRGSTNLNDVYLSSVFQISDWAAAFSISKQSDDGYDRAADSIGSRHDSTDIERLTARLTKTTELDVFDVTLSYSDSLKDEQWVSRGGYTYPDRTIKDKYLAFNWQRNLSDSFDSKFSLMHHTADRNRSWYVRVPRVIYTPEMFELSEVDRVLASQIITSFGFPPVASVPEASRAAYIRFLTAVSAMGPSAFLPVTGFIEDNDNDERDGINWSGTKVWSPQLRTIIGGSVWRSHVESLTYFHDEATRNSSQLYGNVEYRDDKFLYQIGVHNEYDNYSGSNTNPRASLHYAHSNNLTLRAIYSTASRSPDLSETDLNWYYELHDPQPNFLNAEHIYLGMHVFNLPELEPESAVSREIGLRYELGDRNQYVDVRVYNDRYEKLISEDMDLFSTVWTNSTHGTSKGVEVEWSGEVSEAFIVSGFYTYSDVDMTNEKELTLYSRHSGMLTGQYIYSSDLSMFASVYSLSSVSGDSLTTISAGTTAKFFDGKLSLTGTVEYFADPAESLSWTETWRGGENHYNDSLLYRLGIRWSM